MHGAPRSRSYWVLLVVMARQTAAINDPLAFAQRMDRLDEQIAPAMAAFYTGIGNATTTVSLLMEYLAIIPHEPTQLRAAATLSMLWSEVESIRANESEALYAKAQQAALDGATTFIRQQ